MIRLGNVSRHFRRGPDVVKALDRVTLTIPGGRFVALMGPSGSGKSTLLNLLSGIDRADEGEVEVAGQRLNGLSEDELAAWRSRHVGLIFQFFNLIPVLNSVENAALTLTLDGASQEKGRASATEWLKRVGLGERLHSRPDQLSGGQQQRVAIARALVAEPALVLADEPTGNLDTRASDEIAALLRQVADTWGRAVVMVTHDPRIAAYADRIVFLKDGTIVDDTRLDARQAGNLELVTDRIKAME